jgi:type I restriction enzyme S subunit
MIVTKSNIKVSALGLFEELKKEKKKLIGSKTILDKKDNHEYPIADVPFEIPSHWVWCYLSDISLIQEGPGIRKHQYETSGVQFLTVTNILEGSVDLEKSKKYISKEQYKNYSHFTINKGDIVTACSGGSWGKSAIYELDEKLILNTSTLRLRFYNDLGENYYLYYLTKTSYFKDSLSKYITGQQPNYGYSHYSKIPIPLPPLPEQQRIVAILDEAFAAIDKAKANAEQNLKNAKELFESYLQGVFENKGDGWEEKTLGEIASFSQGIQVGLEQHLTEPKTGYVRFIRIVDYTQNTDDIRYVPDPGEKYFVKEDDIVMVRYGTPGLIGRGKAGVIANNLFKITIENNELSKDFLCLCLSQKHIQTYLSTQGSATMPALNFGQLKTVAINFPSLKEQNKIVEKLDVLSTETKKLEAIYQQKINDLEELKKSVLQKAFSGELKTTTA